MLAAQKHKKAQSRRIPNIILRNKYEKRFATILIFYTNYKMSEIKSITFRRDRRFYLFVIK